MIEELKNTLNGENYNIAYSENGARMYETTGKSLLDLSFQAPSLRTLTPNIPFETECKLAHAYAESKELFVKFLFYLRDIRGGMGERNSFRNIYLWLLKADKCSGMRLLPYVPEYGRWDDLLYIFEHSDDTDVKHYIANILHDQLIHDTNESNASLLAKWLPSINGGKKSKASAKNLIKYFRAMGCNDINDASYRKMLSKIRKKIDVLECHIAQKTYGEINYEYVPSVANTRYSNLFLKYDENRRREYLNALSKGEKKINASAVFPHDIYKMVRTNDYGYGNDECTTAEEMWKSLPDFVNGDANTLVVRDGSGSMVYNTIPNSTTSAIDVASALTIYFSERMSGEFRNKFITFSSTPKLVDLSSCKTLLAKHRMLKSYSDVSNTDLEKTFQLILDTAVNHNLKQEELPSRILIVSDMEFDSATNMNIYKRAHIECNLMSMIGERFAEKGYKLPKLIFWNVCSRSGAIPMTENDMGVILVSGYSIASCKMVLSEQTDPYKALTDILMNERYAPITLKNSSESH